MDQNWFESCAAGAEPCQPAVWEVKNGSLKGSDVLFVSPLCAAVLWCSQ